MNLGDPSQLILALKALAGHTDSPPPMYPRGFVKPAKPEQSQIIADAKRLWDGASMWRSLINEVLLWTRQNQSGAFDEDREERAFRFQESFTSTALSDERNLAIAKISTLKPSYLKRSRNQMKGQAEKMESACYHLRREYEYLHARDGNRPLTIDEAQMIVDYGMLSVRLTFNDENPDFPLCRRLIDPTEVYPVYGGPSGLKAVYRVYQATPLRIMETYGDYFDAAARAKFKKLYGDDIGNQTELQCYEYWDEWWRSVSIQDMAIVPVAAHEYGRVPWRIQYTGMGEAMFTRTPLGQAFMDIDRTFGSVSSLQNDRMYKAVPMIFYRIRNHDLYEAIMARIVTGIKKAINPPMVRARTDMAAEKPMLPLDTSPGAQNETMKGEEDLSPIPTSDASASTQIVLAGLATDRETGSFPRAAFGTADRSQVTGVAQQMGLDAGLDKLVPLIKSFEFGEAQEMELAFSLIRNFGEDAKYGGDLNAPVTPLMVPGRRKNEDAFELDRDLIDSVGTRIEVEYTQIDESQWLPLIQAGQLAVNLGVLKREELRFRLVGEHDWEAHFQEWINEQALVNATQLPEFAKAVTVPQAFMEEILAATGDPERQQMLKDQFDQWKTITAPAPPQAPGQAGMPPQGGPPPVQAGGAQQGPPPPPPGSQIVSTAGVSLPQLNQAPGGQGAPVGRPGLNVGP